MSAELPQDDDLRAAIRDLDNVLAVADEKDLPRPSSNALGSARRLLRNLYEMRPCRLEVYPMPDGEVALHVPGGFKRSVIVLCDSDGGALCLVNLGDSYRRARYPSAQALPDDFVSEALRDLGEHKRA